MKLVDVVAHMETKKTEEIVHEVVTSFTLKITHNLYTVNPIHLFRIQ